MQISSRQVRSRIWNHLVLLTVVLSKSRKLYENLSAQYFSLTQLKTVTTRYYILWAKYILKWHLVLCKAAVHKMAEWPTLWEFQEVLMMASYPSPILCPILTAGWKFLEMCLQLRGEWKAAFPGVTVPQSMNPVWHSERVTIGESVFMCW